MTALMTALLADPAPMDLDGHRKRLAELLGMPESESRDLLVEDAELQIALLERDVQERAAEGGQ